MKILPVNIRYQIFKADNETKDPLTGEYKDPLMHWPLRGCAFTNEIGEALRPLIGNYATLSWAPALLYIGADIYDKYKNEQTEYSPNSHRALKQAIFQGMASIFLPLVAVKAGQNIFSLLGYLTNEKISYNTKAQVDKLAEEFVSNGNMRAYHNNDKECIAKFKDTVINSFDYHKNKKLKFNIFGRIISSFEKKFTKNFFNKKNNNIEHYAEEVITELIELRKKLLNPSDAFKENKKYKDYELLLEKGQTQSVAIKSILNKNIKNKSNVGKIIKTTGGFLALGLAIKPIDKFVEEVLIGKIVAPTLDKKKPAESEPSKNLIVA